MKFRSDKLAFINQILESKHMRTGTIISIIGIIMFIVGIIAFYSIQDPQTDQVLQSIKHTGTFMGLMGIGVTVAGILLYLMYRENPGQEQTFGL